MSPAPPPSLPGVQPGADPGVHTAYQETLSSAPAYSTAHEPAPGWQQATGRGRLRVWLLWGIALVGFGVAGLYLLVNLGAPLGATTLGLALLCAAIPLGVVIPTFLWLDRFEAEPTRLLIFAFAWGALLAACLSAFFNTSALQVFLATTDPESALELAAVVVAPVVEEGFKGLLILVVWWFMRREFDGITDGMVYAGMVGAGFAFTENISYLGHAYSEGGGQLLAFTFVGRCLMSPFAHPMFTVLTGIGIGIASVSRGPVRILAPVGGYVLAVLAHGMWNLSAMSGGRGMITVYLLVQVPIFIAFVGMVVWARRREGHLIGRFLSPYAQAGWLSPAEVAMLASMPRRREARMWARTNTGKAGLASMRKFQDAASELALLRRRMYHSSADAHALETERHLLDALVARRREFIGQPVI